MDYLGDFVEDATINVMFTTNDGSGGAVAPSSAFEAADIAIYKDNSATQKATTNGITMTSPFDAVTGLHLVSIDTSNDTGDAGFWATGSDYTVILNPDETVDSQTVVSVLAQFSIQNRYMRGTDSAALASDYTSVRAGYLDNLNIGENVAGTSEITALNDPTAAAIADAVWDEPKADHTTATTFGDLATDLDSVLTDTNSLNDTKIPDTISLANINAEADTALTDFFTSSAQLVDNIWDEDITGGNHNVNGSAARFTREGAEAAGVTGTAQAGGATSITLAASESASDDIYAWERVRIIEGTGAGQSRLITAYNGTTKVATVDRAWTTNPSSDSIYVISSADATLEAIGTQLVTATAQVDFDDLASILTDTNELQTDDVPGLIAALNDLSAAEVNAEVDTAFTTQMADSVSTDGTIATREQALYMILQMLTDFAISGTTLTVRKVDGSTSLMTFTLDDGTNPTSITRAT